MRTPLKDEPKTAVMDNYISFMLIYQYSCKNTFINDRELKEDILFDPIGKKYFMSTRSMLYVA
jgi:hypothetical protein